MSTASNSKIPEYLKTLGGKPALRRRAVRVEWTPAVEALLAEYARILNVKVARVEPAPKPHARDSPWLPIRYRSRRGHWHPSDYSTIWSDMTTSRGHVACRPGHVVWTAQHPADVGYALFHEITHAGAFHHLSSNLNSSFEAAHEWRAGMIPYELAWIDRLSRDQPEEIQVWARRWRAWVHEGRPRTHVELLEYEWTAKILTEELELPDPWAPPRA